MSDQIVKLPKDSHRFMFFMSLVVTKNSQFTFNLKAIFKQIDIIKQNDLGSAPRFGSCCVKYSPCVDDYELVSILPSASISYSFDLCSLYIVEPNVPHLFKVYLEAISFPPDDADDQKIIVYVSNTIGKMVMISGPSAALEVGETELNCPYPEFMENNTVFRLRGQYFKLIN